MLTKRQHFRSTQNESICRRQINYSSASNDSIFPSNVRLNIKQRKNVGEKKAGHQRFLLLLQCFHKHFTSGSLTLHVTIPKFNDIEGNDRLYGVYRCCYHHYNYIDAAREAIRTLFTSTLHSIISKPLAAFPHDHRRKQWNNDREMNPVKMTIINPWKELSRAVDRFSDPPVFMFCTLPTGLHGLHNVG